MEELTEEKKKEIENCVKAVEDHWDKHPPKKETGELDDVFDFFPLFLDKFRDDSFEYRPYYRVAQLPARASMNMLQPAPFADCGYTDYTSIEKYTVIQHMHEFVSMEFIHRNLVIKDIYI